MTPRVGQSVGPSFLRNVSTQSQSISPRRYPREIVEPRTVKRSYGVTPKLTLTFAELGATAASEEEAIRYEPRLAAAGLLTDAPAWTFDALDRSGLVGSRELFLMLKKPRGSAVEARFTVSAEVDTRLGRIPLRRYREPELVRRR